MAGGRLSGRRLLGDRFLRPDLRTGDTRSRARVVWNYLEPPIALLFGALLLGETITPASIAGGVLIGAAVWVVSRAR